VRHAVPALLVTVLIFVATGVWAADNDPPGTNRDWGVTWDIRAGDAGGDYGEFLQKGTAWDMDIYKQKGHWRYGAGLMFGSLGWRSPYQNTPEWAHFETFGYASRVFRGDDPLRFYLQGRFAIVRMHPRSDMFLKESVEDLDPGESPTNAVNGIGLSLIPGFEFDVANGFAIDLSAYLNWYVTKAYNLQNYEGDRPLGDTPNPSNGLEWGARVGATWRPISRDHPAMASALPDTTPLPPPSHLADAWGATRSPGWAATEVLGINFGASMFNEYVRQANFNQISPRSFWTNLDRGFNYDDNHFKTNQLIHPFNGSTYYNASRSNGLSFWPSTIYAITGAFIWEAMGETHPMSYNDMISTGIGGIAFGEATYRLSSTVLDNTDSGGSRTWREVGAFLIDPIRGFNRFLSGRSSRLQGNPSSPYDWRPPRYYTNLGVGARITGTGQSITDSTQTQAVMDLYVNHGSPWENKRRKPFDHFDMGLQVNGNDKVPIGRFQIRGDLFSNAFGGQTGDKYAVAFVQYFDYVNNNAYEFGGQSFGVAWYSRFRPTAKYGILTRVDASVMILGAVNSEYADYAILDDPERLREYDYGPGAGFSIEAAGLYRGRRVLFLSYRAQWIGVTNGSIYNTDENPGAEGHHILHGAGARLSIPVRGDMSVGADAFVFLRQSYFTSEGFEDKTQRVPQARLYLAWDTSR
jgi:hypothetical protein